MSEGEPKRIRSIVEQLLDPQIVSVDLETLVGTFTCPSGLRVRTRLIRPGDASLLLDLFEHLSPESRWRRFHTSLANISSSQLIKTAQALANVDNRTLGGAVLALAQTSPAEYLIGVARLARPPGQPDSPEADAAVVVRDDYQNQGIGTILIYLLFRLARIMKIETLTATVQADNIKLLEVLRNLRIPMEQRTRRGETLLRLHVDRIRHKPE